MRRVMAWLAWGLLLTVLLTGTSCRRTRTVTSGKEVSMFRCLSGALNVMKDQDNKYPATLQEAVKGGLLDWMPEDRVGLFTDALESGRLTYEVDGDAFVLKLRIGDRLLIGDQYETAVWSD